MNEALVAAAVFVCLVAGSLGTMRHYPRLQEHHRDNETNTVVRLVANIFVVMTSLVFGLMINSAKNTFENVDSSVHAFGTNLIILDRTLRSYGVAAGEARTRLTDYVRQAIAEPERANDAFVDPPANSPARSLDALGDAIAALSPADNYHISLLSEARAQYSRLVEQRWAIVEQSEGVIPMPLIGMLTAWMTLIFVSFGYRAPSNSVVTLMFVLSALLIAASVYLVLDMDVPFAGPIQISDAPLRRALAEMTR